MTTPRTTQLHPWEWTTKKWCQLHVNFAGRFQGKTFLKVADAQSKWLKVFLMNSMSSSAVVNTLRLIFATHGLAGVTVSDNGTSFTSAEFQEFAKCNGIHCPCPCLHHPSSNDQAKCVVQTTKEALFGITKGDWTNTPLTCWPAMGDGKG